MAVIGVNEQILIEALEIFNPTIYQMQFFFKKLGFEIEFILEKENNEQQIS